VNTRIKEHSKSAKKKSDALWKWRVGKMDVKSKREQAIARREQDRELKDKQRALAIKQRLQKERSKRSKHLRLHGLLRYKQ
jgi:hypothetical protein